MRILPIGSGKGGVGKSLIATNLAIALAQRGRRVVLADLDLGGSNLHTILGIRSSERGIGTLLNERGATLDDVVVDTEYANLRFVPGDTEIPGVANLKSYQKRRVIGQLLRADCDELVIDLGAGTSFNTLDLFLLSGRGIVVAMPTLTSILNAYLFLKNAVFRIMHSAFPRRSEGGDYLDQLATNGGTLRTVYVPRLADELQRRDPEHHAVFVARMRRFRPRLIHNMLEDPQDDEKADKLRRSTEQYLGIPLQHLGVLYRDELQDIALDSRLPIIIYKPGSVLSSALGRLADKLVGELDGAADGAGATDGAGVTEQPLLRVRAARDAAGELDDDEDGEEGASLGYGLGAASDDDSFAAAGAEAESDFAAKLAYVEELLHSGGLTTGDLVEAVRSQQFEIGRLRKEVQLLRTRLLRASEAGFTT